MEPKNIDIDINNIENNEKSNASNSEKFRPKESQQLANQRQQPF